MITLNDSFSPRTVLRKNERKTESFTRPLHARWGQFGLTFQRDLCSWAKSLVSVFGSSIFFSIISVTHNANAPH